MEILRDLRTARVNTEGRIIVNVRRRHIWEESCRCLQRKRFSPRAIISVCFTDDFGNSEGGVGIGGPCREILRLVVKASNEHSGIFWWTARQARSRAQLKRRILLYLQRRVILLLWLMHVVSESNSLTNFLAREKGHYRLVGVILAWSLLHGGQEATVTRHSRGQLCT